MKDRVNPNYNRRRIERLEARMVDLEDRVRRLEIPDNGYSVARGPGGKWFVTFEGVRTGEKGHDTAEDAEQAAAALNEMVADMMPELADA